MLICHAHNQSRTSARGQLAGGPIASPHTSSRTPLELAKQSEIENKELNTKYALSLSKDNRIHYILLQAETLPSTA